MSILSLESKTSAFVAIDLQQGIAGMATVPHAAKDVIARAARIAEACRAKGALVVLVRVDAGPNGELFPQPITDVERPRMTMPAGWSEIVPEMGPKDGDVIVTKHQPGAFFGTDLDVQLRRRGIQTIILGGIATNIGVEATARVGFEAGYNLVFVEDAMAARDAEFHTMCVSKYFPTIGRVRSTDEVVAAL